MDFITVTGLKELQDGLKRLTGPEMESVLRTSVMAGVRPIRGEARQNFVTSFIAHEREAGHPGDAPYTRTGTLQRSIIAKRKSELAKPGEETYLVTVRKGDYGGDDGFYAVWVEYGHWINTTGEKMGGGKTREGRKDAAIAAGHNKFVRPYPFMRPAFEAKRDEAEAAMKKVLVQMIEEIGRGL